MSATAGGHEGTATQTAGERLGFKTGMVVQELGWDEDVDDKLRAEIEDTIDADMVDGDYGNVVDSVLLWWRDDDGDLVEKGWFPVLDFDAQETLRIASFDDLSATGQFIRRLRVATRVPGTDFPGQADSWRVETLSGPQISGEFPAMGHSITGESFISYYERTGRTLTLCIFGNFPESPATEAVDKQVVGDEVHSACGVNHNSRICVVYGSGGRLKFATRTGIATFDITDVEAGGAWSDLVFDRDGSAHIAHMNGSELRYGLAP